MATATNARSPGAPTGTGTGHDHEADVAAARARIDAARAGRLHILEVQRRLIRTMPKVVIAAVPGWAAGGGHSLNDAPIGVKRCGSVVVGC